MKSLFFIIMGIAMPILQACAQNNLEPHALSIGDDASSVKIGRPLNDPDPFLSIGQLKGKVVIIDYWATWCAPCVQGLPRLDSLQEAFGEKIVILSTTYENRNLVSHFLSSRHLGHIRFIAEDTTSFHYFPHTIIPHAVIIGTTGKVLAITSTARINEEIITSALTENKLDVTEKKDVLNFDASKPLFLADDARSVLFRSLILPCQPGIAAGGGVTELHGKKVGFNQLNQSIPQLFLYALGLPYQYLFSRLQLQQVKDPERYRSQDMNNYMDVTCDWSLRNNYCYDLVAGQAGEAEQRRIMLGTLKDYFRSTDGLSVSMEPKKVKCLVLTRWQHASPSVSNKYPLSYFDQEKKISIWEAVGLDQVAFNLECMTRLPVLNETKLNTPIDLSIPLATESELQRGRLDSLLELLHRKGLDLIPGFRMIPVLVFKENKP